MKKISTLALASLLLTNIACAQAPVFTSIGTSGLNVFAGVKLEQKGMEPETYILEVSKDKFASKKIPMPSELEHREVVALFPAENNIMVVLSQRTVEQGDKPQFHSYNPAKKEWKKLAESDCVSFAKLSVKADSVTFTCVETDKKGDEVETKRKVTLKGVTLSRPGEITLPIVKVEKDNLSAELMGESFEWKQLKVGLNKEEKIFSP
jgi:hypothetical protein